MYFSIFLQQAGCRKNRSFAPVIAILLCAVLVTAHFAPARAEDDATLTRKIEALKLVWKDVEANPVGSADREKFLREFLTKSEPVLEQLPEHHLAAEGLWTLRAIASCELDDPDNAWAAGQKMIKLGLATSKKELVQTTLALLERKGWLDAGFGLKQALGKIYSLKEKDNPEAMRQLEELANSSDCAFLADIAEAWLTFDYPSRARKIYEAAVQCRAKRSDLEKVDKDLTAAERKRADYEGARQEYLADLPNVKSGLCGRYMMYIKKNQFGDSTAEYTGHGTVEIWQDKDGILQARGEFDCKNRFRWKDNRNKGFTVFGKGVIQAIAAFADYPVWPEGEYRGKPPDSLKIQRPKFHGSFFWDVTRYDSREMTYRRTEAEILRFDHGIFAIDPPEFTTLTAPNFVKQ